MHYYSGQPMHLCSGVDTAHDDASVRRLCEVSGASAFLVKPLSNSVLIAAIESAVGSERVPVV